MTQEEAKDYLKNYRKMYADLAPERFLEALSCLLEDVPEQELPEGLDEAAEKYAEGPEATWHSTTALQMVTR